MPSAAASYVYKRQHQKRLGLKPCAQLATRFFFMIRFYLMPWLLGYTVMGILSFPLEREFASGLN